MYILKRLFKGRKTKPVRDSVAPICPWGRTIVQYRLIFGLSDNDLSPGRRILDCGGGPASFTAEASALGVKVVAVDPLYAHSPARLREDILSKHDGMKDDLRRKVDTYVWGRGLDSPEQIIEVRRKSLEMFLGDYAKGSGASGHYVHGRLPGLPLKSGAFDLALVGHLLFLYSKQLDTEFHVRSAMELLRLAPEVRIFPTLAMKALPSPHLEPVIEAVRRAGGSAELRKADYEHMKGGDKLLVLRR